MAFHPTSTRTAVHRTIILGIATVLACLLSSDKTTAQTPSPAPMPAHGQGMPFRDSYQGVYSGLFNSRDFALRLNYDTERYGQQNGQLGVGIQGYRPTERGIWIFSGQYNLDFGQTDRMGLDVGGGFRMLHPDFFGRGETRILGAQLWYDGLQTDLHNYFNEIGFSLESLGDLWDFRINGNFPIGTQTQPGSPKPLWNADGSPKLGYEGLYLSQLTDIPIDEAIGVVDFEVARRIGNYDVWLFGGGYGLDASGETCFGGKAGARGWIGNDALLELAITQDDFFDTKVNFSVVWYPGRSPLFGPRGRSIEDRLRDPVIRNDYIATRRLHEEGGLPVHDSSGNVIRVVHVDGDGTSTVSGDGSAEDPYNRLASVYGGSRAGDIVLVHSSSTYDNDSITLRDRQRLLGEGTNNWNGTPVAVVHKVTTEEHGEVVLPETSAGASKKAIPTINNPSGAAVTLAAANTERNIEADNYNPNLPVSKNEVSNLYIDGGNVAGSKGIVSASVGIGNVDINNMTIKNTDGNGIELTPFVMKDVNNMGTELDKRSLFTVMVEKTQFTGVGGDDIHINAMTGEPNTTSVTEDIQILNVASRVDTATGTNGDGWGIFITGNQNSAFIDEYDFNGGSTATGGIRFERSPGGATVSNAYLAGGSTDASKGYGVSLYSNVGDTFTSEFTFNDVEIKNTGGAGFHVSGGATNATFTGKITQSNNAPAVLVEATQDATDDTLFSYHSGTLNFNEMNVNDKVVDATAGTGLVFNEAIGTYNFNNLISLKDVTTGIDITNDVTDGGTYTFSQASIINPNDTSDPKYGAGLRITGGQSTVNFSGLIQQTSGDGYAVDITDHSGTVTFTEAGTDTGIIQSTAGNGLNFANADGTYTFSNKVLLSNKVGAGSGAGIKIADNGSEGSDGTFTFNNIAITDINGIGLKLNGGPNGGTATVNFTGKIEQKKYDQACVKVTGNHTGTVTFTEWDKDAGVIKATCGSGLVFGDSTSPDNEVGGANGTYIFNDLIDMEDSASEGYDLTTGISIYNKDENAGGTFTFSNVKIANATDAALRIDGGKSTVAMTGLITQSDKDNTGYAVDVKGNHTGTLTMIERETDQGIISATYGKGLNFNAAHGTYTFSNKIAVSGDATSGATQGINITNSDGNFTFSNAALTNIKGVAFNLNSGTADVAFTGLITQKNAGYAGAVIAIGGGHSAGTETTQGNGIVTFSEKNTGTGIVDADTGTGLVFGDATSSDGANGTYTFNNLVKLADSTVDDHDLTTGIDIKKSTGTFTFKNAQISNASTAAFRVDGETSTVNFTGQIKQDKEAGKAVHVCGKHSGTINFNELTQNGVINEGVVIASKGAGLVFDEADGTYNFNFTNRDVITTDAVSLSGDAGIAITDSDGTFKFADATVTDSSIVALNVNGGTANIDFTGKITKTSGGAVAAVRVVGGHTGSIEFTEIQTGQGVVQASVGPGLVFGEVDGTTFNGAANGTYTFNYNGKATTNAHHAVELSGSSGIAVTNSDGTFNFEDITVTNSSIKALKVEGGKANINFTGKITANSADAVSVSRYTDSATPANNYAHTGTITMNEIISGDGIIEATGGTGLVFTGDATAGVGADGTYMLNDKITLSGGAGVSIKNSNGSFTLGNADSTITNTSGTAFSVNGGKATIAYAGKIASSNTGRPVVIQNVKGGSITFNNKISSTGYGILIGDDTTTTPTASEGNKAGTFNFNGQVTLNMTGDKNAIDIIDNRDTVANTSATTTFANLQITTEGGIGLNATSGYNAAGSGIVQVTGNSNTIDTTKNSGTGTAIYMDHAEIGTSGVRFANVVVKGATNGIYLNDVVGNGAITISDGTITNTTGDGVIISAPAAASSIYSLATNNATISLNSLEITNPGTGSSGTHNGINIVHANKKSLNVAIADCAISTSATANGDGVHLDASGTGSLYLTLTGNTITQGSASHQAVNFDINSGAANTYLTLNGANTIKNTASASGSTQEAFLMTVDGGTCYFKANGNNTFSSNDAESTFDIIVGDATLYATVQNNSLSNSQDVDGRALTIEAASENSNIKLNMWENSAGTESATGKRPYLLKTVAGASYSVVKLTTPNPGHNPPEEGESLKEDDVDMSNGGTYDDNTGASTYVIKFDPGIGSFTKETGTVPTPPTP